MALYKKLGLASAVIAGALSLSLPALRAEDTKAEDASAGEQEAPKPARQDWSFSGPFGTFDRAQLQRGFQIYKEVCSNCHELHIPMRTLSQPGGPEFTEAQVKALAETYKVKDGPNEAGDMFERPGRPSDYFPAPFPNPEAAAAALTASPPDMSLLAKARKYEHGFPWFIIDALPIPGGMYQELGPDYIYSILNGYAKDDDPNYNTYFPGHKIAMGKPLSDGAVTYTDGTPAILPQYAKDVTSFLYWAAEPSLEQRKRVGFRVLAFLLVFAGLLYFTKKRIWEGVAH